MKRFSFMSMGISAVLMFAAVGCDVDVEEEGRMPEVEVTDPGQAPEVDVEGPEVETRMERKKVDVPTDVDIKTEEKEVEVPDVDIDAPNDDEADLPEEN